MYITKYSHYCTLLIVTLVISACVPVGGNCQYTESMETVQVLKLGSPVEMQSESGEMFEVDPARLMSDIEVGQYYELELHRQTSGSCTPIMIKSITRHQ